MARKSFLKKRRKKTGQSAKTAVPISRQDSDKLVVGPPIVYEDRKDLIVKIQHVEQVAALIPGLKIISFDDIKRNVNGEEIDAVRIVIGSPEPFKVVTNTLTREDLVGYEYIFEDDGQCYSMAYGYDYPVILESVDAGQITLVYTRVSFKETNRLWKKGANNLRRHLRFMLFELTQESIFFKGEPKIKINI